MSFFDFHTPLGEQWEPFPEAAYSNRYLVSNLGRVKSLCGKNPIFRRQSKNKAGYPLVALHGKTFSVHRLVARAFLGDIPEGMEVNHKNGVKFDNRVENLEFTTRKENMRHCARMGLFRHNKGERNHASKLSEENVREIRKQFAEGISAPKIGKTFGVSNPVIYGIVKRKFWRHVE